MDEANGHLFDDAKFGDACTKLDVKERLETRERNKREDQAFQFKTRILERATEVTKRSIDHEARILKEALVDIRAKTAYFQDAFKPRKTQLYGALTKTDSNSTPMYRKVRSQEVRGARIQFYVHSKRAPFIPGSVDDLEDHTDSDDIGSESKRNRTLQEDTFFGDHRKTQRRRHVKDTNVLKLEQISERERESIKNSTRAYIRKSRYVVNSLGNIYRRRVGYDGGRKKTNSASKLPDVVILQSYGTVRDADDDIGDTSSSTKVVDSIKTLSLQPRGLAELGAITRQA